MTSSHIKNILAYSNYLFTGFEVVPGYYCYDVYHNKHIKEDIENYPIYLQKVFKIK